ncbi:hypothetical protein [Thalassospira tepidiphila]|uniref:hypothetical protein n=1 Tax=Thalassospira tepidiphila TaxID=393657 RepID=UPI003AA92436
MKSILVLLGETVDFAYKPTNGTTFLLLIQIRNNVPFIKHEFQNPDSVRVRSRWLIVEKQSDAGRNHRHKKTHPF